MNRHLNDDELIGRLYGIELSESDRHLEECEQCSARRAELQLRKSQVTAPPAIADEVLAAQRRRIYMRMDEPGPRRRWVPAVAAAALLAVGLFFYRPAPAPPLRPEPGDEQLFSEVYSMAQSTEPEAAAPIHALFEENQ